MNSIVASQQHSRHYAPTTHTRSKNDSHASGNELCAPLERQYKTHLPTLAFNRSYVITYQLCLLQHAHDLLACELCVHNDTHEFIQQAVQG